MNITIVKPTHTALRGSRISVSVFFFFFDSALSESRERDKKESYCGWVLVRRGRYYLATGEPSHWCRTSAVCSDMCLLHSYKGPHLGLT